MKKWNINERVKVLFIYKSLSVSSFYLITEEIYHFKRQLYVKIDKII